MTGTLSDARSAASLVGHSELSTADVSQARQYLADAYRASVRISSASEKPVFELSHVDAGAFAVGTLSLPVDLRFETAPPGALIIGQLEAGRVEQSCADGEERLGPGDVFLNSKPDLPFSTHTMYTQGLSVTLSLSVLAEVAGPTAGALRFTSLRPATPALADAWTKTLSYVRGSLLAHEETAVQPLVIGQAARLLAATALNTFPNTAIPQPTPTDSTDATPDTVRRAIAYIEEQAHNDLSLTQIAAGAHVTPRALQYAFRVHCGISPLGHVRRARLDRAHFDLLEADADGGATVATIAARWGFANVANFAAHYRDTYGLSPSETLAK